MGEVKLLPCPFCGGNKIDGMFIRDGWRVGCMECGGGVQAYHPEAHKRAAEKWNRRDLDAAKDAEIAKLRDENEWKPIASCPFREPVDLWCVYGGEEFAQFEGGASIGMVVSNRIKTKEYGFFGNQSNDGVPRRDGEDLVPVAWRRAVPSCPATLIAEALGIPLTLEEALAKEPTP